MQSIHATYHLASKYQPDPGIPNVVWIGVADLAHLIEAQGLLEYFQIPHYSWTDDDYGFTAMATCPITKPNALHVYKVLRADRRGLSGSLPDARTNTSVAQRQSG